MSIKEDTTDLPNKQATNNIQISLKNTENMTMFYQNVN